MKRNLQKPDATGIRLLVLCFCLLQTTGKSAGENAGMFGRGRFDTVTEAPLPLWDFLPDEHFFGDDMQQEVPQKLIEQWTERQEFLEYYRLQPLDLNNADEEELRQSGLLDERQIRSLLHYRESYGKIVHLDELRLHLETFPETELDRIRPFVCLQSRLHQADEGTSSSDAGSHSLLFRYGRSLDLQEAYRKNKYAGTPDQYYFKYACTQGKFLKLGIAAQQDAGEPWSKKGFDFYSGHVALCEMHPFQILVLGTYKADFGFGLNIGNRTDFFSRIQPGRIRTAGNGIRPYASGGEYGFLQGVAVTIRLPGKWKASLFYSVRNKDASFRQEAWNGTYRKDPWNRTCSGLSGADPGLDDFILSVSETGYHRTRNEIAKKGMLREQFLGLNTEKDFTNFRLGSVLSVYQLGGRYNPELPDRKIIRSVSQIPALSGLNVSGYYQWLLPDHHLFGEIAFTHYASWAVKQGWQWNHEGIFAFGAEYSFLSPLYHAPYGQLSNTYFPHPSKDSRQRQEFSWGGSLQLPFFLQLLFSGNLDSERKNAGFPAWSHSSAVSLQFSKNEYAASLAFLYGSSSSRSGHQIRIQFSYLPTHGFIAECRIETRNWNKGLLMMQDFGYRSGNGKTRLRLRLALFHTQDYQNRLYAYEHDVLYGSSVKMFHGKGFRAAFLFQQEICRGLHLEVKYAQTLYDGVKRIGSGDSRTEGFLKPEIKLQVRYKILTRKKRISRTEFRQKPEQGH